MADNTAYMDIVLQEFNKNSRVTLGQRAKDGHRLVWVDRQRPAVAWVFPTRYYILRNGEGGTVCSSNTKYESSAPLRTLDNAVMLRNRIMRVVRS